MEDNGQQQLLLSARISSPTF